MTLMVNLSSFGEEFPTSVMGFIIFESGNIVNFDWRNQTQPKESGVIAETFSYNYTSVGNKIINLQLFNNVSTFERNLTVTQS